MDINRLSPMSQNLFIKPKKFINQQNKAIEQKNLQYKGSINELIFSQNSDIIEESRKNKHVQPINDVSIRKVKALNGGAYSYEQNKIIQAKHKELLEFAGAVTNQLKSGNFLLQKKKFIKEAITV